MEEDSLAKFIRLNIRQKVEILSWRFFCSSENDLTGTDSGENTNEISQKLNKKHEFTQKIQKCE